MKAKMDGQMERGQQWLNELLRLAAIASEVNGEWETDSWWLTIDDANLTPEQVEILIGSKGEVLDAIQYLANTIGNIGERTDEQTAYTIELNGYRSRRQEELRSMATQAAEQAIESGDEIELKELSSAERRQIHNFLKEYPELETYSRGQEPDRRLVVRRQ